MTIQDAQATAKRKARYGHRPWIVWQDNTAHAEPATAATIKAAMLATGTQGHFTGFDPSGTGNVLRWGMALTWLRNARIGQL